MSKTEGAPESSVVEEANASFRIRSNQGPRPRLRTTVFLVSVLASTLGFAGLSHAQVEATGGIYPGPFSGQQWELDRDLYIGWTLEGAMTIATGGSVSSLSGGVGHISNGIVTVDGGSWTNRTTLVVGGQRTGLLTITSGTVSNTSAFIGTRAPGTVNLSGGNWTNSDSLHVGTDSIGSLDVSGGTVSATSIRVGIRPNGVGEINLTGGELVTGQLSRGAGWGTVSFNGGVLRLTGDQPDLFVGFEAGAVTLVNDGGVIDTDRFSITSALELRGDGELVKRGSGSLTLTGNNTYEGGTRVREGTLNVTGSTHAMSSVSVAIGASLGGTGTVGTISIAGSLRPAVDAIGTLHARTAVWTAAETGGPERDWLFDLGEANTSDRLSIEGDFLKEDGEASVFRFDFGGSTHVGTYSLVNWTGVSSFVANDFSYTNLGGGNTGSFAITGSALQLTVIPEPSSFVLLILAGSVGYLASRRDRRRSLP